MSRRRKMITSTRGSLHVTDDKTQGIIWRSTHKEETGWMSRAGREKNRLNGNLKETSLIKHMITVLTDEKPIWQKWLYSMRFETSMYEIWSMTVYYNKLKDHRSYRWKWDRKEGPSTFCCTDFTYSFYGTFYSAYYGTFFTVRFTVHFGTAFTVYLRYGSYGTFTAQFLRCLTYLTSTTHSLHCSTLYTRMGEKEEKGPLWSVYPMHIPVLLWLVYSNIINEPSIQQDLWSHGCAP